MLSILCELHTFLNRNFLLKCSTKKSAKDKKPGKGGSRFWKSIGLGFKTPREAIEGIVSSLYLQIPCVFKVAIGRIAALCT